MNNFLRQTTTSFIQKRLSATSTPASINSIRSKRSLIKQQKSISQIYQDVKIKLSQMEATFKNQKTSREREMLQTYIKILEKIGKEVVQSKERYLNLDKQALKTDKRLQIVQKLNMERQGCNKLSENIKNVKKAIKNYQDENNYLQKQVEALQKVQTSRKLMHRQQRSKYSQNKKHAMSLQRKIQPQFVIQRNFSLYDKGLQSSDNRKSIQNQDNFIIENKAHDLALKDFDIKLDKVGMKKNNRPHTQQNSLNYLGKKRRKNVNLQYQIHQNIEISNNL